MRNRRWAMVAVAAMAAAAYAPEAQAQNDTFEWTEGMRAGTRLEVRGIVGRIQARPAEGNRASVVAVKDGRSSDFDEVEIRVEETGDGFVVCAVYRPERSRDGCRGGRDDDGDRRWRRRSIDVEVDFEVSVPAGVDFHANMVSGDIEARGLRSEVRANTVSGEIDVQTSEGAWGNTVSGSIELEMGSIDWDELDLQTVSGDITLWLPRDVDTDVDFESLSGDVRSDFDITMTRRNDRRWIGAEVEGYIGDRGRRKLKVNTVSGDLRLKRGPR